MEKRMLFLKKGVFLAAVLLMACLPFFQGCGGSSSSSNTSAKADQSNQGRVFIGLTDAQGDFINYTVDITSLKLYKANGTEVDTLPLTTRVDFAQLTSMTEFLTASTIPSGAYVKAVLTLDYSHADIEVENAAGEAVKVAAADIRNEKGETITTPVEVSVSLEDLSCLVIAPGIPKHLSLDFDLEATNEVTFSGEVPTVKIAPCLKADLSPRTDKIHRLRGPLESVDTAKGAFTLILRPFANALCKDKDFGTARITVDGDTHYLINGTRYEGEAGLAALAQVDQYTGVVALGDVEQDDSGMSFVAREVFAGTSIPGCTSDAVLGNVVKRDGSKVVIKGATLYRKSGGIIFHNSVEVTLGSGTRVFKQFSADQLGQSQVSVGQRILVFGNLTSTDLCDLRMDASEGYVRMYLTTLSGTVVSKSAGRLTMRLQAIDGRNVSLFDFSRTFDGATPNPANDADPDSYTVDAGTLSLASYESGEALRVKGFVNGVDAQIPPDFKARTIVKVTECFDFMNVGWGFFGSAEAFSSITQEGLSLAIDHAGIFKRVNRGGIIMDLTGTTPEVVPSSCGCQVYTICDCGIFTRPYASFKDFAKALDEKIDEGARVQHLYAWGTFDQATDTLAAKSILVALD
jgi:hypothetical protein